MATGVPPLFGFVVFGFRVSMFGSAIVGFDFSTELRYPRLLASSFKAIGFGRLQMMIPFTHGSFLLEKRNHYQFRTYTSVESFGCSTDPGMRAMPLLFE